ncbi:hypothetical protein B0H16DRAFT_1721681 [Mycena metata]|uniref:BTB domain-containing protein n=1 Tax=Mycena metata TaxID=1033252 RepID=A0AAD7NE87_9AGAR|nr:hypothetical protein B0H16DRAFT_1721681 [Mycena metata]
MYLGETSDTEVDVTDCCSSDFCYLNHVEPGDAIFKAAINKGLQVAHDELKANDCQLEGGSFILTLEATRVVIPRPISKLSVSRHYPDQLAFRDDTPQVDDHDLLSTVLTRAANLWYDDGNLIIQAEEVIFRVSRGILAQQSAVLADVLSLDDLANLPVFEGCPVIQFPHRTIDVENFLMSIFRSNPFASRSTRITLDSILAAFRLGTAYSIPKWPQNALFFLSSVYPTTFEQFLSIGLDPSYCRDQIIPVIQFARAHALDWILPVAFYRFCLGMSSKDLFYGEEYAGSRVTLSLADQTRCHQGEQDLRNWPRNALLDRYVRRASDNELIALLGVVPDLRATWAPSPDSNLCDVCLANSHQWHSDQRRSLWEALPQFFGLSDWTVLNELKDAALEDEDETF